MIIRAPRPDGNYTLIRNDVLRDQRLSFRSRGILGYLLSLPNNWHTDSVKIAAEGAEGREAVRTCLTELETVGYVIREKIEVPQERGSIFRTAMVVYDTPEAAKEAAIEKARKDAERAAAKAARAEAKVKPQVASGNRSSGARGPGRPESRTPEEASSYKDCSTKTEGSSKEEPRARADSDTGTESEQPIEPSSASEQIPDQPRAKPEETDQRARIPESDQLFGSADSSAGAADCPPPVAPPPPKGKRPPAGKGDPDFERFWSMAPKYATHHAERKEAWDAWLRARKEASVRGILTAWEAYTAEWATWDEEDWEFIPSEKTWLKGCRWRLPVKPRKSKLKSVKGARPSQVDENLEAVRRARAAFNARQAGRSSLEDVLPVREASGRPA